jgi:hypothetical protein
MIKVPRIPVISGPIYLRDAYAPFAALEGDCPESERTWVKIRQATEGENEQRADLTKTREVVWGDAVTQRFQDNEREIMRNEVYFTLQEAGNLTFDDGSPIFPGKMTNFDEFTQRWWKLDSTTATAIHKAVLSINRDWDWKKSGE